MIAPLVAIAAGGAAGALSRHALFVWSAALWGTAFPWGTLLVNIAGGFLIGLLTGFFAHWWQPPLSVKYLLIPGFLGGFTTFSAFSLDLALMLEKGAYGPAFLYAGLSLLAPLAALFAGLWLIRLTL